jgi:hypothetical protein
MNNNKTLDELKCNALAPLAVIVIISFGALASQWQKDIDYMVSAIEAGRPIEPQLLSDVGIEI